MLKSKADTPFHQNHREQIFFSNTPDHKLPRYRYGDSSTGAVAENWKPPRSRQLQNGYMHCAAFNVMILGKNIRKLQNEHNSTLI